MNNLRNESKVKAQQKYNQGLLYIANGDNSFYSFHRAHTALQYFGK